MGGIRIHHKKTNITHAIRNNTAGRAMATNEDIVIPIMVNGRTGERTNERTNGRMNEWMDDK